MRVREIFLQSGSSSAVLTIKKQSTKDKAKQSDGREKNLAGGPRGL